MPIDQIRREEIDESIEKGTVFTIMNREEARYAIAKVANIIDEKNILSKFLPTKRKSQEGVREAKLELMKVFNRQLQLSKVYPRASRDSIIAFIGGYVTAYSNKKNCKSL
jgi:hypothetical protein